MVNGAGVRFRTTLDMGTDAQGRRRQETRLHDALGDAREHVRVRGAELRAERKAGRVIADRISLDTLCDRWLESRRGEVREVTRETYAHALKPVRRRLGTRMVHTLTHADVLGLRTWLVREGGRNGQGLGEHAAKASLDGLEAGARPRCPGREDRVRERRARGQAAEGAARRRRWAGALDGCGVGERSPRPPTATPLGPAYRLSTLGLRREEVLGLTWDAVDFEAGTIAIRQTRVAVSSSTDARRWMLGPVKSRGVEEDDPTGLRSSRGR